MAYLDGFVLAVPRDQIDAYCAMAKTMMDIWLEHGALSGVEAAGHDVPEGVLTSFPMAVKAAADEVVFFSFITYRDRAHRDAVNAAVMADPRTHSDMHAGIFDAKRMIWGGFDVKVSA